MRKTQLGCTILEGHDVADLPLVSENAEILEKELLKKATQEQDGRMSKEDKTKLDGIEAGANKYVHPKTHSADIIIPNADRRFVSDTEKEAWNAKETPEGAQAKVDAVQANLDEHKADYTYQKAGGTATAITLVINEPLEDGYPMTFIASANNNGAATTINGKRLYKPNTTETPNLIKGKAYTVWYNSTNDCFFIKASAEGNAVAENVLAGKTFSNDNDTGVLGSMPNIGKQTGRITTKGGRKYISKGYHDGTGYIDYNDPNHVAANIKHGINIGGVLGTYKGEIQIYRTSVRRELRGVSTYTLYLPFQPGLVLVRAYEEGMTTNDNYYIKGDSKNSNYSEFSVGRATNNAGPTVTNVEMRSSSIDYDINSKSMYDYIYVICEFVILS